MSRQQPINRTAAILLLLALAGCQDGKGPAALAQPGGLVKEKHPPIGTPTFAQIQYVSWSGDGKWLVTASRDSTITIWDAGEERKPPPAPIGRHTFGQPRANMSARVALAQDLLVDEVDRRFTVRQISTGKTVRVLGESQHAYGDQFRMTPDAKRLVALNIWRQEFNVWDVRSGQLVHAKLPKTERRIEQLVGLSADGSEAYVVFPWTREREIDSLPTIDGVHAVRLDSGEVRHLVRYHTPITSGFHGAVTPGGSVFIDDRSWDLATGREAGPYPWRRPEVVSADGRWVVALEGEPRTGQRYVIWDVAERKRLGPLPPMAVDYGPFGLSFSPDGTLLAVGGSRQWAATRREPSGLPLDPPQQFPGGSPRLSDGKANHVEDRALVLVDVKTRKLVRTLAFPVHPLYSEDRATPEKP